MCICIGKAARPSAPKTPLPPIHDPGIYRVPTAGVPPAPITGGVTYRFPSPAGVTSEPPSPVGITHELPPPVSSVSVIHLRQSRIQCPHPQPTFPEIRIVNSPYIHPRLLLSHPGEGVMDAKNIFCPGGWSPSRTLSRTLPRTYARGSAGVQAAGHRMSARPENPVSMGLPAPACINPCSMLQSPVGNVRAPWRSFPGKPLSIDCAHI